MKMRNAVAVAAVVLSCGNLANAGGLSPQVMETPKVSNDVLAPAATSSIEPAYVIFGVLAALLLTSALRDGGNDDDGDDDTVKVLPD